jgi:hypothetical protein
LRLLATPTPGAANSSAAALGSPMTLRINEWMALPSGGEDWVELYNPSSLPVELSGLYLTDDPSIAGQKNTQIRELSFIASNGYAVFDASGTASLGPTHMNFRLAGEGEALRLYSSTLALIDGVDFGVATNDVSRGRYPDGDASQRVFPATASRGAQNYIDTDGDGLPDAWELANGLNPLVADADSDFDGDGASNGVEFWTNTNPQNSVSLLRSEVIASGDGFAIRFNAESDRTYTVQYKSSLGDPTWQKLRDVPSGTARAIEIVDPAAMGARRFYRVITPRTP